MSALFFHTVAKDRMKMDLYAAYVFTLLYLQSLCLVRGASLPVKNSVDTAGLIVENRNRRLQGEGGPNDVNFPRPTPANFVAGFTNRSDHVFGINARISSWGHEHIRRDAYSAAAIQVSNDQGDKFSAIRAGLHTFPSLYNDSKVHVFAQWTRDRDWKTGCYNTDCPGFIPFRVDFGLPLPGMVFEGVSSYNQTDSSLSLQIVKDERPVIGGDWWLYYAEGPMTARLPLGFWPQRLFDGDSLGQYATEAAWYGAVGFGARGDEPAMGSGHGPGEGPMRAAYFASISLMGRDAFPVEAKLDGLRPMVNGGCYQVAMDAGGNNTFFYGGPVAPSCNFR